MMGAVESAHGLIGRVQWLSAIGTSFDAAAKGHGQLLLITGEPGIGKSALLRAAAELAAERGMAAYGGQLHTRSRGAAVVAMDPGDSSALWEFCCGAAH